MAKSERVFLVGVLFPHEERWEKVDSLDELESLCKTAGAEVIGKILQRRDRPHPGFLIGEGKAHELREIGSRLSIDTFVFDEELSPRQVRNLESVIGRKIIDRTELILDIFAQHARTKASKIEVELTQLNYRLSRLTGRGVSMSQLAGGIGTRGPGEKQLEYDRRKIKRRIQILERKLKDIERSWQVQAKRRSEVPRIALVGYTNTGKSTLMNAMAHANVVVDDKLFSTLDAVTRRIILPSGKKAIITDTIGFIRRLPHGLISSFKTTLQEAIEADLRLHVVDASHPHVELQILTGNEILDMLGVLDKPMLYVFNKIDRDKANLPYLKRQYPGAVFVSALRGDGIDELKEKIDEMLKNDTT